LVKRVGHLGQEGGQILTSNPAREFFGGVGLHVAGVIDWHWLQKAAMDLQRTALALIGFGALTAHSGLCSRPFASPRRAIGAGNEPSRRVAFGGSRKLFFAFGPISAVSPLSFVIFQGDNP
jgi:hypothetical protein